MTGTVIELVLPAGWAGMELGAAGSVGVDSAGPRAQATATIHAACEHLTAQGARYLFIHNPTPDNGVVLCGALRLEPALDLPVEVLFEQLVERGEPVALGNKDGTPVIHE